ncbi:GL27007 [Drosophila persimilis]|uniref:GL27007 n=1 Tax=Drosophila persimilis TaxID=7234 RepID=B4H7E5_DROPE|nr:GL27007 [Drosophila persimilis]
MKCQLLFVATVCLVTVWALPVPDEEVAIQPDAGSKAELLGKTVQTNPIEPAPFKPEPFAEKPLEPKIDAKTVPAAPVATLEPAASIPAAASASAEPAKTELKLSAPDVETAPAIPEKVNADEVKFPPLVYDDDPIQQQQQQQQQRKAAGRHRISDVWYNINNY